MDEQKQDMPVHVTHPDLSGMTPLGGNGQIMVLGGGNSPLVPNSAPVWGGVQQQPQVIVITVEQKKEKDKKAEPKPHSEVFKRL